MIASRQLIAGFTFTLVSLASLSVQAAPSPEARRQAVAECRFETGSRPQATYGRNAAHDNKPAAAPGAMRDCVKRKLGGK
jgi:hypothetical protein